MLYRRKKTIFVNFRNNTVVMRKASGGGKHRREFHSTDFKMLEKGGMEPIIESVKSKNILTHSPSHSTQKRTSQKTSQEIARRYIRQLRSMFYTLCLPFLLSYFLILSLSLHPIILSLVLFSHVL